MFTSLYYKYANSQAKVSQPVDFAKMCDTEQQWHKDICFIWNFSFSISPQLLYIHSLYTCACVCVVWRKQQHKVLRLGW